ncbi:MAG: hypothetical protein JSU07_06035 [Bacteroidetes bacterium]|nr:hypothetical protein [Bacteroidota bacterium]
MRILFLIFLLLTFCFFFIVGCKKNTITTSSSARLSFSQDSVLFDTVFTTIGSSTKNIRVRNKNNQAVNISSIFLQNGSSSQFIINVDGLKGTSFKNLEIAANDSMYIFIQVNVNPTNHSSPVIIEDKIIFQLNGNTQQVKLEAWGQDAYYHRPNQAIKFSNGTYLPYSLIDTNKNVTIVWPNDKPHVIYGYLVVDSTQTLFIQPNTKIFMNYKAGIWVYRYGTIKINGALNNEVVITGARLDLDYRNQPGQWDRIWINEGSLNNTINYAIIKNGYIGIQTELIGTGSGIDTSIARQLTLTNTKIQNMSQWGLYSFAYNVYGANNVISNCQEYCLNILLGGKHDYQQCTFANYWNNGTARTKPCVNINNYAQNTNLNLYRCNFLNCIIDGNALSNEVSIDLQGGTGVFTNYFFSNTWLRTTNNTSSATNYFNVRTGHNVNFNSPTTFDFSVPLSETQVANFTGTSASTVAAAHPFDISGFPRNTTSVTAGAYQAR